MDFLLGLSADQCNQVGGLACQNPGLAAKHRGGCPALRAAYSREKLG